MVQELMIGILTKHLTNNQRLATIEITKQRGNKILKTRTTQQIPSQTVDIHIDQVLILGSGFIFAVTMIAWIIQNMYADNREN